MLAPATLAAEGENLPPELARLEALADGLLGEGKAADPACRRAAEEALRLREREFPAKERSREDARLVPAIDRLARLQWILGDYSPARPLLERTLAIRRREPGEDSLELSSAQNNLAMILHYLGDYEISEGLYRESLAIRRSAFASPSGPAAAPEARARRERYLAQSLSNLSLLLLDRGKGLEARRLAEEALPRWRSSVGPSQPELGSALNNLAWILQANGDAAAALPFYAEALAIREKARGAEETDLAWTLGNLALLHLEAGRDDLARPLAERALAIRRQGLGPRHPLVAQSLGDLARLDLRAGKRAAALEGALLAEEIGREHVLLGSRVLADRQALRAAVTRGTGSLRASGLDVALSLAPEIEERAARRVWDSLLRSRLLVLDEMAARRRAAALARDPAVATLRGEVAARRERMANLLVRGPAGAPPEAYQRLLDETRQRMEEAERSLAERSLAHREEAERVRSGLEEVLARLPPRSALLAYARYKREGPAAAAASPPAASKESAAAGTSPLVSYLAFAAREGAGAVRAIPLGPAAAIDGSARRFQEAILAARSLREAPGAEGEAAARRAGEELRRAVWDPAAPAIAGAEMVLVVLDGELQRVNFAALPTGEREYLVESGPAIHYLSSERDLLPSPAPSGSGLLALGGAAFDEAAKGRSEGGGIPRGAAGDLRGASEGSPFASIHFEDLPATRAEAEAIAAIWREAGGEGEPALLMGRDAGEAALKARAPGNRILHLATHGFFIGEGSGDGSVVALGVKGDLPPLRGLGALVPAGGGGGVGARLEIENPLRLSGLALAGANRRGRARPGNEHGDGGGEEDGILTAEEIASLDLSGVEWAVLSACDTGAGDLAAGEGVIGLRRSFQIAGARTLVLSLWPVRDDPARRWMEALYRARLLEHRSTAESVRAASRKLIGELRDQTGGAHPYLWAAFIGAGDWR